MTYPPQVPLQNDPRYANAPAFQGYPSQTYAPAYPPAPPVQQPYPYPQQQPPAAPAYAPQQQGQPITPPVPQLRNGSGGSGTPAPKFRHLLGRTIIVEPIRVDETAMDTSVNPPVARPEAYFHLTVVDGGPLQFGDSQDRDVSKQRPNTHEIDTPCRFTNVNDRSFGFVQAVRDALSAGEHGRVGVVQQGTKGNKPYLITKCETDVHGNARPDGEARFAAAMEIFGKIWQDRHNPSAPKQFVSPEPRSLVAQPAPNGYAPAAQQVNYGYGQPPAPTQQAYTSPAPQGYAYGSPQVPTPYGPQNPAAVHPAYTAAVMTPPASQPSAPTQPAVDPAYAAWLAAQQQPTPAPAPSGPPLPPEVEAWLATLPAEQQAGSRAAYLTNAGQPAAAGPGI